MQGPKRKDIGMKAKLTKSIQNGQRDYNKPIVRDWSIVTLHKGELKTVLRAECRMGASKQASVVHANIWVSGPKETSGYGRAGGYGYHKISAAIGEAIDNAGIELYGSPYASNGTVPRTATTSRKPEPENLKKRTWIDGVGDRAIDEALMAIVRAAGYRGKAIFA